MLIHIAAEGLRLTIKEQLTNNTCVLVCDELLQVRISLELHRSWSSLLLKKTDNPIYRERQERRETTQ